VICVAHSGSSGFDFLRIAAFILPPLEALGFLGSAFGHQKTRPATFSDVVVFGDPNKI
jgi:hypothetical protein